jgi:hypothetical protein
MVVGNQKNNEKDVACFNWEATSNYSIFGHGVPTHSKILLSRKMCGLGQMRIFGQFLLQQIKY